MPQEMIELGYDNLNGIEEEKDQPQEQNDEYGETYEN